MRIWIKLQTHKYSCKTPHSSPLRVSYGVSVMSILEQNIDVIMWRNCAMIMIKINPRNMFFFLQQASSPSSHYSQGWNFENTLNMFENAAKSHHSKKSQERNYHQESCTLPNRRSAQYEQSHPVMQIDSYRTHYGRGKHKRPPLERDKRSLDGEYDAPGHNMKSAPWQWEESSPGGRPVMGVTQQRRNDVIQGRWHESSFCFCRTMYQRWLAPNWVELVQGTWSWLMHDVIRWKHFLRYWPFVWGIHQSPVTSPHKIPLWAQGPQRLGWGAELTHTATGEW